MAIVKARSGAIFWAKKNLFPNWFQTILTVLAAVVLFFIAKSALGWVFFTAKWDVIAANYRILMLGQYPAAEMWRIWFLIAFFSLLLGLSWGIRKGIVKLIAVMFIGVFAFAGMMPFISMQSRAWLFGSIALMLLGFVVGHRLSFAKKINMIGWVLYIPVVILFLNGFGVFTPVASNLWGGFLLTVLLAVVTNVASFPLGILLMLGRRSKLPVVRWFCIAYIEIVRGVPMVTVLFMAQLLLPLFLGDVIELSNVLRVMIGLTLFNAAYLAETIRGGMQAVPRGQYEAAEALGLNYVQKVRLIILPQALRNVIPALVNNVIGLFKDTSLVAIVSLMDLMGMAKRIIANPEFVGRQMEVFLFVAAVFLIFCMLMSKVSQRLETNIQAGKR